MLSDGFYVVLLVKMMQQYFLSMDMYLYVFMYVIVLDIVFYYNWISVVYGDELVYIFGVLFVEGVILFFEKFIFLEKIISEIMMRYWINFVKIGY